VKRIFESMVELSDRGGLLERFLALPLPKMFMYGQQNRSLSYLRRLAEDVDGASWGCRAASPSWWCGALAGAVRGRPHMGGVELVARRGRAGGGLSGILSTSGPAIQAQVDALRRFVRSDQRSMSSTAEPLISRTVRPAGTNPRISD
jgi:hypothetical protein